MSTDLTLLPARQCAGLKSLEAVAARAGGQVADVTWLHRTANGQGFLAVSEMHVEIELADTSVTLVFFDGVADNRLLTQRCGEPWTDVAARGW